MKSKFETEIKNKKMSLFLQRQVFHDVKSVLSSNTMKVFIVAIGEPYLKKGINNSYKIYSLNLLPNLILKVVTNEEGEAVGDVLTIIC